MADIPTVRETAARGCEVTRFFGYLAPAGMPVNVIRRLNETLTAVIRTREVSERVAGLGADASTRTPEEFVQLMRVGLAKWSGAVKASGVLPQ